MSRIPRGGNFSFTKWNAFVKELTVVFNWKVMRGNSPLVPHVVPIAIACDSQGRAVDEKSVVFANQLDVSTNPAVSYRSATPDDGGDSVVLDLDKFPAGAEKVFFVLLVNPDVRVPSTFSAIRDVCINVVNRDGEQIIEFPINDSDIEGKPIIEVCEIYRFRREWKFRANLFTYANFSDLERKFGVKF